MCLICVELTKNTLTSNEARRNLGEMKNTLDKDHMADVLKMIWEKESEESILLCFPSEKADTSLLPAGYWLR